MKHSLSKSTFLRGLQCGKSLWLHLYRPDLATPPDAALLGAFETGKKVGELARSLFPGGRVSGFRQGGPGSMDAMVEETAALMAGGAETLYEAAFRFDGVLVLTDILNGGGGDGLRIYEVKSSTAVKDVHLLDLAIQHYVVEGSGAPVAGAFLVHINNGYTRQGPVDPRGLFTIADLTGPVRESQGFIKRTVGEMREVVIDREECPDVPIGPQCRDPYECDFIAHCWKDVPNGSVFELKGKGVDKFALYRGGRRLLTELDPAALNESQRMQVAAHATGKRFIDRAGIRAFLDTLGYPLYFLDFETFRSAIPPFDGTRPYEQIPFQYSLHWLERPGGEPGHSEFLADPGTDGRSEIAGRLARDIPPGACVLTYNMRFEKAVLEALARHSAEHGEALLAIAGGLSDLMTPFRKKLYYTREMRGSYSLKAVAPALCQGPGYDAMAIKGGEEASLAYLSLQSLKSEDDAEEAEKVRQNLLEYCRFDTLVMIRLLEKLESETVL